MIQSLIASHARALGATEEEAASAARVARTVLRHPVLERARTATGENRCRREVPVTWRGSSGVLIEGVIDLAFRENGRWTVVDFKSDEELRRVEDYAAQIRLYITALQVSTGEAAAGILMRI
jgi:ATP-dependent helicase/nuclease subunit A